MEKKYIIKWRSITTGKMGEGTATFTKEQADQIVKDLNEEYKGFIDYWKEEVHAFYGCQNEESIHEKNESHNRRENNGDDS